MQTAQHLCPERTEHTTHRVASGPSSVLFVFFSLYLLRFWQIFLCFCEISNIEKCTALWRFVSVWGFSCFLCNMSHISAHHPFSVRPNACKSTKTHKANKQTSETRTMECLNRLSVLIVCFVFLLKWDNDDNNGFGWHWLLHKSIDRSANRSLPCELANDDDNDSIWHFI